MNKGINRWLVIGGITAVFVGYLAVWLPGPAAGLRFIGVEMGEWTKFVGVGRQRNLFYLPPITLSLILLLLSTGWSNRRWTTWIWRGTAVLNSLLVFPALEDLTSPARGEYLSRIGMIGLVLLVAGAVTFLGQRLHHPLARGISTLLIGVVSVIGAVLPSWMYTAVLPAVNLLMGQSVGIGVGVWLSGLGHIAFLIAAVRHLALSPPFYRSDAPVQQLSGS